MIGWGRGGSKRRKYLQHIRHESITNYPISFSWCQGSEIGSQFHKSVPSAEYVFASMFQRENFGNKFSALISAVHMCPWCLLRTGTMLPSSHLEKHMLLSSSWRTTASGLCIVIASRRLLSNRSTDPLKARQLSTVRLVNFLPSSIRAPASVVALLLPAHQHHHQQPLTRLIARDC